MTTNGTRGYRPGLVDLASGQISREIFVNDDIYAQEQERVFARSWLFVRNKICRNRIRAGTGFARFFQPSPDSIGRQRGAVFSVACAGVP